jgi:hypothetical protein
LFASGFGFRPSASGLRASPFGASHLCTFGAQRLRRCAPAALHESKGGLQLLLDSASSKHLNLHWSIADFRFNYTLNSPLVDYRFLLQLNIHILY